MPPTNERAVNKWLVTVSVMTGTLMSAINTSSVNVALPYIQGTIGASTTEITWVVASYLLANVIIMPVVALLGLRFGRKKFYFACSFLFTVGSIACGFADSLSTLIIFRILQGLGGGALVPLAQAIMRETFPPHQHGTAMGIYGLGVVLGPALGPSIGGYITDTYSWHWVFFANVPFGILNMFLVALFIFDPSYFQKRKVHIDYWGLVLLVVGLGALQIMLQKGEEENWFESALIQRLAITSFVGITLFIIWELIAKSPAVNLRILKNINLSVGTFIGGILGVGLYGSLFLLPRLLQQLLGYPAFNSGVALIPRAIAMAIAMPLAGLLYNRLKVKLIAFGLILSIISFFQLSHLNLSVDYWAIFLPQFLQGLGFGFIFVPLSTTAFITIEKPLLTAATGLYNVVRQVAGSVGTAIAATGISAGMNHYRAMIVEHVNVYNNITSDRLTLFQDVLHQRGSSSFTAEAQAYKLLERTVNTQSSMLAYNRVFFVILCLFLVSLFLLVLFRKQKS